MPSLLIKRSALRHGAPDDAGRDSRLAFPSLACREEQATSCVSLSRRPRDGTFPAAACGPSFGPQPDSDIAASNLACSGYRPAVGRIGTSVGIDYDAHNEEVRRVWQAYRDGRPERVPMVLGISAQWMLSEPGANPQGHSFADYVNDRDVMLWVQLHGANFVRHHVPQDREMGLPERWVVHVDGQNVFEAGWLGANIVVREDQPPSAEPVLSDERKREILDSGAPGPFEGKWAHWCWERYEYFCDKEKQGLEFMGRPVCAGLPAGMGTDGPLTIAYQLRGATGICEDMLWDEEYFHALMSLVTEAVIARIKAYHRRLGREAPRAQWGFADDAVALLSAEAYRDHVLPYHKRLVQEFGGDGPNSMHLCGDVLRLLPIIRDELNVRSFDTGYPFDFARARAELGPDVEILGGPHVHLLRSGPPAEIEREVRRIMRSGIREGGKFILREANNVAPGTPVAHLAAMYEACKKYGRY